MEFEKVYRCGCSLLAKDYADFWYSLQAARWAPSPWPFYSAPTNYTLIAKNVVIKCTNQN